MMRKLMCMLLAVLLLAMPVATAFAAGPDEFDMSQFNLRDYILDYEDDGRGFITPNYATRKLRDYGRIWEITLTSTRNFSYLYPYVYVKIQNYQVTDVAFKLKLQIANDQYPELKIHTVEFTVGNNTYVMTITDVNNDSGTLSSGAYYDDVFFSISEQNRELMDAIMEVRQPVQCVAYGENITIEFTLGMDIIETMCDAYTCFIAAGGMEIATTTTPMTVQNPLEKFLGETKSVTTPLTNYAGYTNAQWMSTDENRALLASLLAYDLFSANPAWADVLGYAYGACYTGMSQDGKIHLAIQTALSTYYIVYDGSSATASVKTGAAKMTDNAAATAIVRFAGVSNVIPATALIASTAQQAAMIAAYNAAGTK